MTVTTDRYRSPLGLRKPLAGYLRLTVDRQGNKIGYDVQQRAIEALAQVTGDSIGEWYKDKDLTAADLDVERPEYERMLKDIASGKWGGIVVWRLDRLVRLVREFERVWGVVQDSAGFIASAEPMISTRDDIGLMFMRLLVMFAEMEISGMKIRARGHQDEKRRTGKYKGGGSRPFGFEGAEKDETGRILNPGRVGIAHVPAEVDLIREAAERLLNKGERDSDVLKDWARRNIRGTRGSLFNATTLRNMLTSPRVAGLRDYVIVNEETGEEETKYAVAEWAPVLDRASWERLCGFRKVQAKRGRPHGYLLTGGLVVCGRCGKRLVASRLKSGSRTGVPGYRCDSSPKARVEGACGSLSVLAEEVDAIVIASVLRRCAVSPELLDALSTQSADSRHAELEHALAEISDVEATLEMLAGQLGRGMSPREWQAARAPLVERRERAVATVDAIREAQAVPAPLGAERDNLIAWYGGLTLTQQRAFIRAFVLAVRVLPPASRGGGAGRGVAFDPRRVEILPTDPQ